MRSSCTSRFAGFSNFSKRRLVKMPSEGAKPEAGETISQVIVEERAG
jgi:hypothetical protein